MQKNENLRPLQVKNDYLNKTICTSISPGLTIIVGRNGYGKTTFLRSLEEQITEASTPCVSWNDNEYGRSVGKDRMLHADNMAGLASMMCRSEGETMLASFSEFFMVKAGAAVRHCAKHYKSEIFFLIDQIDSGLDIYQLDEIKDVINNTIIPDLESRHIAGYFLMTANSFEVAEGEDCLDPVTGKHYRFDTLAEYRSYIKSLYDEKKNAESITRRSRPSGKR